MAAKAKLHAMDRWQKVQYNPTYRESTSETIVTYFFRDKEGREYRRIDTVFDHQQFKKTFTAVDIQTPDGYWSVANGEATVNSAMAQHFARKQNLQLDVMSELPADPPAFKGEYSGLALPDSSYAIIREVTAPAVFEYYKSFENLAREKTLAELKANKPGSALLQEVAAAVRDVSRVPALSDYVVDRGKGVVVGTRKYAADGTVIAQDFADEFIANPDLNKADFTAETVAIAQRKLAEEATRRDTLQ